ncbi:hypothetical protein R3P38DRAFT_3179565 [Favolaschia claudopus]|uniref:Uncharacterized protein n=1 Tax=Favolaschia claudopus TaxID=2862362 RepID=A0AAW0CRY5_9AGAR
MAHRKSSKRLGHFPWSTYHNLASPRRLCLLASAAIMPPEGGDLHPALRSALNSSRKMRGGAPLPNTPTIQRRLQFKYVPRLLRPQNKSKLVLLVSPLLSLQKQQGNVNHNVQLRVLMTCQMQTLRRPSIITTRGCTRVCFKLKVSYHSLPFVSLWLITVCDCWYSGVNAHSTLRLLRLVASSDINEISDITC